MKKSIEFEFWSYANNKIARSTHTKMSFNKPGYLLQRLSGLSFKTGFQHANLSGLFVLTSALIGVIVVANEIGIYVSLANFFLLVT